MNCLSKNIWFTIGLSFLIIYSICSSLFIGCDEHEQSVSGDTFIIEDTSIIAHDSGSTDEDGLFDGDRPCLSVECSDGGMDADVVLCQPCVVQCQGKQCGDDSCGGECGKCNQSALSVCVDGAWICAVSDPTNCAGKQCGPDSVGGQCGQCPGGWTCDGELCQPTGGGCSGVPSGGLCINGFLVTCLNGTVQRQECQFGACSTNTESALANCDDVPCLPDCFGKTCGDDGCGGNCGDCGTGKHCELAHGICLDDERLCENIPAAGICIGQVLVKCADDTVSFRDCLTEGMICSENPCSLMPECHYVWPGTGCGNVPQWGHCGGDHFFNCVGNELRIRHCAWFEANYCKRISLNKNGCGH